MIKVLNLYLPRRWAVLVIGESLLILLALAAAVALQAGGWPAGAPSLNLWMKAALITLVCQVCLHYCDLYAPGARSAARDVLARLLQALGVASLILALVYWLLPEVRFGTGLVVGSVIAILLVLLGWRRAMDWEMTFAQRIHPAGERLLVLGTDESAATLAQELCRRPQLGLTLMGALTEGDWNADGTPPFEARAGVAFAGGPCVPILGGLSQASRIIADRHPHRIVLALRAGRRQWPLQPLIAARIAGIRVEEAPALFERVTGRVALDSIHPEWLLLSDALDTPPWFRCYQCVAGTAVAALGLVLLSPLLALVAIAIRMDSHGPIIYRQQRVGRHGRCFDILKFRSMRADAESATGPVWAQARDPRITRVGRWLRKLRLDELPQLFNVLRGHMSIVGPRPERPKFVEEFRRSIPFYDLRHSVCPGITGWAQVSRDYGASLDDAREKLEYDLFYIKHLSIWMDLFILFQTTKIIALGRGAR